MLVEPLSLRGEEPFPRALFEVSGFQNLGGSCSNQELVKRFTKFKGCGGGVDAEEVGEPDREVGAE